MANIVLKTFAAGDEGQGTVTPQDDALIYQNAVSVNGIFGGATVTLTGANTLHVASGFGIICGRFFEINESDISVQLSSSGTLNGRLKIHLDLNNADNPIEIVTETGATLPALSGDSNININGGAFDMELCTFSVNELTISSLVNTFPTIDNTSKQIRRKTAYAVNDFVLCQSASDALIFICTTAGTTAVQEPTAYATVTDGNTVTDGTAVFKAVSVSGQITQISKIGNLSNLNTTDKSSTVAAINEVDAHADIVQAQVSDSDDAYSSSKAYVVDDLCIYNNKLYRCTTACSAGSWATNQSCFTVDTLTGVANKVNSELTERDNLALPLNSQVTCALNNCTGTLESLLYYNLVGDLLCIAGRYVIRSIQRTGSSPGVRVTLPNNRTITINSTHRYICGSSSYTNEPRNGEATQVLISTGTKRYIDISATETFNNVANDKNLVVVLPMTYIKLDAIN